MSSFPILSNLTPHEHERFAAHRELEARLKQSVRGEIRFDSGSRALYAVDASNYRQLPIGVVLPRDAADVEAALAACREVGAAVLPRGAGTSLAGQCANVAVVFDYSKYMNRLASIDPATKLAIVEPGIVLDSLRDAAERHQLTYAPDPATHNRCTLGGMIGNNSCGVHGLLGGKVVDNVDSLDIVLYDGTRMTVGKTSAEELDAIIRDGGRRGQIYAGLKGIRDKYANLVRERFPRIPRRVSGYNLDELLPERGFHVARALVGTEGTCVNVLSATLNLTKSPQHRVLVVLGFPDAFAAADAVPLALQHKPIGLEGFDHLLVEFMRRKGLALTELNSLPKGVGFLLVEIGADSPEEAHTRAEALARDAGSWPDSPAAHVCTPEEAKSVWHVRESALGAVVFVPGEPDRCEGWEDAAVPPELLGKYLRAITKLMDEYGYTSPFYGHYGQGCVHTRINFDFRTDAGLRKFREFIDRAADVVIEFGGSFSGEHGDGQSRAVLLPKMFGPELMQAFREFKHLWDPDNKMNPGKLVDAVRVYDPVENLRYTPTSPANHPREETQLETHFVFAKDHGSLELATERCVGVGACRKASGGVMCPSYQGTGEEMHSTRGRAHLLWEMLAGSLRKEGFQSEAVNEALSLCLSCKACKSECPVQVDMAQYKAEFLAQRYKGRMHPLQHYIFGFADKMARFGSVMPGLTNAILNGPMTSPLIKWMAGVAKERRLPELARRPFVKTRKTGLEKIRDSQAATSQVLLWPDTWNNYYHPGSLNAAESLLTEAGFRVEVPRGHICCGRPLYDFGLLDHARSYLKNVLDRMEPQIQAGLPFIFLEPSCASVFKDELPELFPSDRRATLLRDSVWLLADFLAAKVPGFAAGPAKERLAGKQILIHGHCHHKAVFGGPKAEVELLRQAGANVWMIEAGCCGMAGPFGFEVDKFEVSKTIANQQLLPAVEKASDETIVVADGFSCREQIEQLGHRQARHFAEVLADSPRK
ncbi:FAD-binding and (Fe-S)-binding domain-containing protein [Occallatibacter riparius]|uniref:FAD-binding oxidoreductase n=1 Tax=Occallatibacter riparius TaxID=1002689 RepID=A0A9J7BQ58_9BACT|nr:FAD-binding and (Fe-S)-binding domain-containing protein [Occallatibacter riparius]UWZ84727.1 FAD-binding oxidoreductase [Occallatibacter riparius]